MSHVLLDVLTVKETAASETPQNHQPSKLEGVLRESGQRKNTILRTLPTFHGKGRGGSIGKVLGRVHNYQTRRAKRQGGRHEKSATVHSVRDTGGMSTKMRQGRIHPSTPLLFGEHRPWRSRIAERVQG